MLSYIPCRHIVAVLPGQFKHFNACLLVLRDNTMLSCHIECQILFDEFEDVAEGAARAAFVEGKEHIVLGTTFWLYNFSCYHSI